VAVGVVEAVKILVDEVVLETLVAVGVVKILAEEVAL